MGVTAIVKTIAIMLFFYGIVFGVWVLVYDLWHAKRLLILTIAFAAIWLGTMLQISVWKNVYNHFSGKEQS